jgi:hypothetical protein
MTHSTDYQTPAALSGLVRVPPILTVGPGPRLRCAGLWALVAIERELVSPRRRHSADVVLSAMREGRATGRAGMPASYRWVRVAVQPVIASLLLERAQVKAATIDCWRCRAPSAPGRC